ncbi:hypothetical protein V491_09088 [Pseudogymnoascus sp. VKM F-3775]|nr:hypothetical protein V491_09088 [Pseudogymnoascus sp. VKM F-3775]
MKVFIFAMGAAIGFAVAAPVVQQDSADASFNLGKRDTAAADQRFDLLHWITGDKKRDATAGADASFNLGKRDTAAADQRFDLLHWITGDKKRDS